jgi:hypothetical protein
MSGTACLFCLMRERRADSVQQNPMSLTSLRLAAAYQAVQNLKVAQRIPLVSLRLKEPRHEFWDLTG